MAPLQRCTRLGGIHMPAGPAMLLDAISTVVVEPGYTAHVTAGRDVRIELPQQQPRLTQQDAASLGTAADSLTSIVTSAAGASAASTAASAAAERCDPIQLAVFSHRFMGIAEQMGRVLQRTSVSVNIKERLDFSCALYDAAGAGVGGGCGGCGGGGEGGWGGAAEVACWGALSLHLPHAAVPAAAPRPHWCIGCIRCICSLDAFCWHR